MASELMLLTRRGRISADRKRRDRAARGRERRSAFLAERALPLAVFGPVLDRAFARFALIFRALVISHFPDQLVCFR